MAVKAPLANYSGTIKELQAGDTISGASGSSPLTTKGDIHTFSTVDDRLPVGADRQELVADSAQTTGLRWRRKPAERLYLYSNFN